MKINSLQDLKKVQKQLALVHEQAQAEAAARAAAALLGSLILVTRYEASKVDDAWARKIAAAADQARAEA